MDCLFDFKISCRHFLAGFKAGNGYLIGFQAQGCSCAIHRYSASTYYQHILPIFAFPVVFTSCKKDTPLSAPSRFTPSMFRVRLSSSPTLIKITEKPSFFKLSKVTSAPRVVLYLISTPNFLINSTSLSMAVLGRR